MRHGAGPRRVSGCARRATAPEEVVLLNKKEKVRNKTDAELRALSTGKDETNGAGEKTLRRTRKHLLCPYVAPGGPEHAPGRTASLLPGLMGPTGLSWGLGTWRPFLSLSEQKPAHMRVDLGKGEEYPDPGGTWRLP